MFTGGTIWLLTPGQAAAFLRLGAEDLGPPPKRQTENMRLGGGIAGFFEQKKAPTTPLLSTGHGLL